MDETVIATLLVTDVLEALDIPYFIGGSFASAEDTILAKLEWYRLGGEVSELQWREVQGIFQLRSDQLDIKYLQQTAKSMQLSDLLDQLLNQSES